MIFQQQFKGATPVPAIYSSRESVEAGGLMSYEPSLTDAHRQIASMPAASSRVPSRHFSRLVTVGAMVAWFLTATDCCLIKITTTPQNPRSLPCRKRNSERFSRA